MNSDFCVTDIFDLSGVCSILSTRLYTNVTLQFPDQVLPHCVTVYQYLKAALGDQYSLFIVADSTFGTSVDDVSAMHVDSQVIVYFGSDLSCSGTIPIIVVPPQSRLDCSICASKLIEYSNLINATKEPISSSSGTQTSTAKILLTYDACYYRQLQNLVASIETIIPEETRSIFQQSIEIGKLPPSADLLHWQPSNRSKSDSTANKIGGLVFDDIANCTKMAGTEIWYLGSKREQISSIALGYSHLRLLTYNPETNDVQALQGSSTREFQERIGGMLKVENCKVIGLLVGSMGLSKDDSQAILTRLRRLIVAAGKKYYTFVMGRLNAAKLSNFPEVGVYCMISNEDTAIISAKTYHVPVITPFELELGLGALEWSSKFLSDSTSVLTNSLPIEEAIDNVKRTRVERGQESEDEDAKDEEEIVLDRVLVADIAEMRASVEAQKQSLKRGGRSTTSKQDQVAVGESNAVATGCPADKTDSSNCACGAASSTNSTSIEFSTALVKKSVAEGRLMVLESAASEYYDTRTFKGLSPDIPENHSTRIVPGQFGIARDYAPLLASSDVIRAPTVTGTNPSRS